MRKRLFAVAAALSVVTAAPCLALTVQTAPPSPDLAQRLAPTGKAFFGLKQDDAWTRDRRPADGSSFSSDGTTYRSTQSFGSATVTTRFSSGQPRDGWADPHWDDQRRETPAPLSLSLPRR